MDLGPDAYIEVRSLDNDNPFFIREVNYDIGTARIYI